MYEGFCSGGTSLQSPFLLAVRSHGEWQLAHTGLGKLHNLPQITDFFRNPGVPFAAFNAHFVSGLEFVGGLLLVAGLSSRLSGFLLVANMSVPYWTAAIAKRWSKVP